jgi:hypothetical protein
MKIETALDEMTMTIQDLREEVMKLKVAVHDVRSILREGTCAFVKVPFVAQHTVKKEPPFFEEPVDGWE